MAAGCDIRLEVQEGFPSEPFGEAGIELSRVIQEALTNARRHSGAQNVRVRLGTEEGGVVVAEVADDGRGFGPESEPGGGSKSMRERAIRLEGTLEVKSAPGEGTRVRVRAPMRAALRSDSWAQTDGSRDGDRSETHRQSAAEDSKPSKRVQS